MPADIDYKNLYELLTDILPDYAIFLMDPDGRITHWNPGVKRILGYEKEDFVNRNFSMIFTEEEKDAADGEIRAAIERGRSLDIRWHLRKNQLPFFCDGLLLAVHDETGRTVQLVKVVRHITPTQLVSGLGNPLVGGIREPLLLKDLSGRYVYANDALAKMIGRPSEDIIYRKDEDLFPEETARSIQEVDRAVISEGGSRELEETIVDKDGAKKLVWVRKTAWLDEKGQTIGLVGISRDITRQREAERQREQLFKQLQRSNEDLAQFSSVVSHDLKAPLRTVKSYAALLAKRYQGKLDQPANDFISFILKAAGNMDKLIGNLLQYARAAEEPMRTDAVPTESVVEAALTNLHAAIEETGAECRYENLPTVQADHMQLLQVFQNLIGNAIKYRRPGVAPRVWIRAAERTGEWLFSVKDNSMGLKPKDAERIFVPFVRLHGSEIAGTGIGLPLCRKIVERHGGRIWVESQPGEGSTFLFTMPKDS